MLHGADLSTYQRGVNYLALAGAVQFGYVKATDARSPTGEWVPFVDPMHAEHTLGLRKYECPTGSYCFAHPSQDPIAAADWFVDHAWFDQLRPVLDYESLNPDKSIPKNAGPHCKAMLERVVQRAGVRPIIYSSTSYGAAMVTQCPELANEDWWAAAYPGIATSPDYLPVIVGVSRARVLAWQWTGTGTLPGISGDADRDVAPELAPLLVPAPDLWPGHERVGS